MSTGDIPSQTSRTGVLACPIRNNLSNQRPEQSTKSTLHTSETAYPINQTSSLEFCTDPFRLQEVYLLRPSSLISMLQIAKASILNGASNEESRTDLHLSKLQAEQGAVEHGYTGRPFWEDLPTTVPTLYRMLNLNVLLASEVCCPSCFALHGNIPPKDATSFKQQCDDMRFLKNPKVPKENHNEIFRSKCNTNLYTSGSTKNPCRIFHYQSLRTWIAKMMFLPGFENALDASLERKSENTEHTSTHSMTDVWDGRMWNEFECEEVPYTSRSGNLVFGLYCDWFNPHGKSTQRRHSTGSLLLICLSLSPDIRYKQENIFLFATIPGPQEPKIEQMNHLLRPLVEEFQDLWRGIFFNSTNKYPDGRHIRGALWPVIADLPAARKVAGFPSHSATLFCAHCALIKKNISETDIRKWPLRCNHLQHANEWNEAKSLGKQESIFSQFGSRWTVLSKLPYWQSIEFVTVDVMHCVLLGMLKDHANLCLGLQDAGSKLKAQATAAASRVIQQSHGTEGSSLIDASESGQSSSIQPFRSIFHSTFLLNLTEQRPLQKAWKATRITGPRRPPKLKEKETINIKHDLQLRKLR